jgi:hypothetical protein
VYLCEKMSASNRKMRPKLPNKKEDYASGLSVTLVYQSASQNNGRETCLYHQLNAHMFYSVIRVLQNKTYASSW